MNRSKMPVYAIWTLQVILGLLFLAAGAGKFLAAEVWIGKFSNWGFPDNFYMLIGIFEIAAAIGIFIPKFSRYSAMALAAIMIGATGTHLLHREMGELLRPGIFLAALSALIILKNKTVDNNRVNG